MNPKFRPSVYKTSAIFTDCLRVGSSALACLSDPACVCGHRGNVVMVRRVANMQTPGSDPRPAGSVSGSGTWESVSEHLAILMQPALFQQHFYVLLLNNLCGTATFYKLSPREYKNNIPY